MADLDPFGAPAGPSLGNGVAGEEDPAAAFLAQQESEIAGIENDEAFAILDGGAPGPQPHGEPPGGPGECRRVRGGSGCPETRSGVRLRAPCNSCCWLTGRLRSQRGNETPVQSCRNLGSRSLVCSVSVCEPSWVQAEPESQEKKVAG